MKLIVATTPAGHGPDARCWVRGLRAPFREWPGLDRDCGERRRRRPDVRHRRDRLRAQDLPRLHAGLRASGQRFADSFMAALDQRPCNALTLMSRRDREHIHLAHQVLRMQPLEFEVTRTSRNPQRCDRSNLVGDTFLRNFQLVPVLEVEPELGPPRSTVPGVAWCLQCSHASLGDDATHQIRTTRSPCATVHESSAADRRLESGQMTAPPDAGRPWRIRTSCTRDPGSRRCRKRAVPGRDRVAGRANSPWLVSRVWP